MKLNDGFLKNFVAIFIAFVLISGAYVMNYSKPVYAAACSTYDGQQASCEAQIGCTWDVSNCSIYNNDPSSCNSVPGCSYPGAVNDCSGFDESTCLATSGCGANTNGCSWDGMSSCTGGGSCSSYGDESNCNSATYFTGCAGNYDNGSCAGTFNPGTCSGTFDNVSPLISSIIIDGATLTLTYDEDLDVSSIPNTNDFYITYGGVSKDVSNVDVTGSTVILTMQTGVTNDVEVYLSYISAAAPVQDTSGNDAANLTSEIVTNNTLDTFAPTLLSARVNGSTLTLKYDENLDGASVPSAGSFSVTENGSAVGVSSVDVVSSTTILTLSSSITSNVSEILVSYTEGVTPIQDAAGNDVANLTSELVIRTDASLWTERTGSGSRAWHGIASSNDGTKLAAAVFSGYIYTSTDSGANWTERTGSGSRAWYGITSSPDGTKLAAVALTGYIYTSTDSGANWTERVGPGTRNWFSIKMSSDGTKLAAVAYNTNGYIYTSTDSGANWTQRTGAGLRLWTDITMSSDGTKLAAAHAGGYPFTSTDSGANWTERTGAGSRSWSGITSSSDGSKIIAVVGSDSGSTSGYIYSSTDSGATWSTISSAGSRNWGHITASSDGTKLAATVRNSGYIYTSINSGSTWVENTGAGGSAKLHITSSSDGTKLAAVPYSPGETDNPGYIYTSTQSFDTTGPVISEVTPVPTPTNDISPNYTFTTNEAGTITYGGSCGSLTTSAVVGSNTITFVDSVDYVYNDCTIVVTDSSGNDSNTLSLTEFTIDTTGPTVSLTAPADGATVSGSSVTISADASDTTAVAGVQFKRATNTNIGSEDTTSAYSVAWDTTGLSSGSQTLIAVARDLAGNYSTSTSRTVTVSNDSTDPIISEVTPVTTPTNDTTPAYTFTTNEAGTISYGGSCSSGTTSASSGSNTISFNALSDGTYSNCTITVTDAASNASSPLSVTSFVIDTTAPTTSGAPDMTSGTDSGSSSSDNITSDTTPTFTGSCTDGNTVQLYEDGVSSGSSTTCASSVFSLTTGTLATGSNSITFKETDVAGNTSSASTALVVTIDITSPTISEDGAIATGTDTTPDYSFTSNEAGTISYGGSCSSVTTSALASTNTITLGTLAEGTYSDCTIIVTDVAGNASNTLTLTSFTISSSAPAPEPETSPSISGSSPSRTQTITNTNDNTPKLPACGQGESFNRNTGLPCSNNTPVIPGCSAGFSFSILTGQACSTQTNITPTTTPTTPTTPNTPSTYKFLKDIPFGTQRSEDVRQLQIFLNSHNSLIALTGAGSPGKETSYFGPATRTALIKFQKANGITPSVGYFGPKTRNFINSL
jgi:uncharacterized repeat protein (TIGR02059 family)